MPEESVPLDLTRFSESARRRLYDRIAEIQFAGPRPRDPDKAGLQIVHFAGRWFAAWMDLDEPAGRPLALRARIVRVGLGAGGEIALYEV
jgi:hypothetical protein